ncbi:MAG: hypothetical protein CMJ88_10450 [Planctomycetes bacterium]|nr:hypothetical protein [Planctomycetota bacterium]
MTPSAASAGKSLRVAALCCSVLVLLLPALAALTAIGDDAAPGELSRLERVVRGQPPGQQVDSNGAQLLFGAAVLGERWPTDARAQRALLVRARTAQVVGVACMALLLYVVVALAGGRIQALLSCAAFALLPPVGEVGFVLRGETVGGVFTLLSVAFMQAGANPPPALRGRRPRHSAAIACGLFLCAATAIALGCEAVPSLGESLLVPGVVLLTAAAGLALRGRRAWRRRGLMGLPIRAINRRLIPWTALGFVAPAVALFVITRSYTVSVDALEVTTPQGSLLPASGFGYAGLASLTAAGALALTFRVGARSGRGARISSDLILFSYCAVFLLAAFTDEVPRDPLPLAPAAAALAGIGAHALLVAMSGLRVRLRR